MKAVFDLSTIKDLPVPVVAVGIYAADSTVLTTFAGTSNPLQHFHLIFLVHCSVWYRGDDLFHHCNLQYRSDLLHLSILQMISVYYRWSLYTTVYNTGMMISVYYSIQYRNDALCILQYTIQEWWSLYATVYNTGMISVCYSVQYRSDNLLLHVTGSMSWSQPFGICSSESVGKQFTDIGGPHCRGV